MADKAIQDLPRVDRLEVDDLLVVGDASNGYNAHAATGAIMRILVKEQASEAVAEIESKVSEASQAATSAAGSADAAQQYAQNATDSAEQSATSAQQSETSATDAQGYVRSASDKATLSQSWAVGGTGSREGEDTDNAKYWAEQAHNAAGGGVVSFNSRTGVVVPQDGDYTPDMVGAVKKVPNPTAGDFPVLTADGHLQGSGKKPADFAAAPLGRNLTLYVNATTGDDSSDGLTASTAKKTITAAISIIPKDLGSNQVTVNIEEGVYDEALRIEGFRGELENAIYIKGAFNVPDDQTRRVTAIRVSGCNCGVQIDGMCVTGSLFNYGIYSDASCNFRWCRVNPETGSVGCVLYGVSVMLVCNVYGRKRGVIIAKRQSTLIKCKINDCAEYGLLVGFSGSGNGAIAFVNNTTFSGNSIDEATDLSGQIFK